MMIVGADVGKYKTKIKHGLGKSSHLSRVATWREIKDDIRLDDRNFVVEYNDMKFLIGDIAEREGQNYLNDPDVSKSSVVTLLNLLVELDKLEEENFKIIVANPFGVNTKTERQLLRDLLEGKKEFIVNGRKREINIEKVGIAPEAHAAWYAMPKWADMNILDFGSSTIHAIGIRQGKLNDKRSHTFPFGFETMLDHNLEGLMQSIHINMKSKWNDGDKPTMCIGGKAPHMFELAERYYPTKVTLHPDYEFATALGLHIMGVNAYEGADKPTIVTESQ